jgi:ferric-dicitrate binding protein FerR (iron transport regulator)
MDSKNNITDEDLGRWLNGDMTKDELMLFEKTEAYHTYKAISDQADYLVAPEFNTEQQLNKLKQKIEQKSKETKTFNITWYKKLAVAASIALLFGSSLLFFFNGETDLTNVYTAQGETKTITLPNQSTIDLNVASEINYNADAWNKERTVDLKGEAYFKVTKGNKFQVNTSHGSIEVLGTEFNIRNRLNTTEIICYTGKVRVTDLNKTDIILIPNQSVQLVDGHLKTEWTPQINSNADWKEGVSSFHGSNLDQVIDELQNQYNIKVEHQLDTNRPYTGAFPHDNIEEALNLIFKPLQINYTYKNDSTIILK